MKPTELLLPVELAQALYDYIATRPFVEVERLAIALRALKPVPTPAPEVEAPTP